MPEASLLDRAPITRPRLDVDEYHRMAEVGILHEDDRVELIEGELVGMTPIGSPHAGTANRLTRLFVAAVDSRAVVTVRNPVRLDRHNEPQPDLMLLWFRDDDYYGKTPTPDDVLLLVEVADSSLRVDRSVKFPLYGKHGIPEVWIVSLADKVIEACRDPGPDGYRSVTLAGRGASLEPTLLPGVVVEAADVLLG